MEGLQPQMGYLLRALARNEVGWSRHSAALECQTAARPNAVSKGASVVRMVGTHDVMLLPWRAKAAAPRDLPGRG